jgi:hypothetical protein
MEIKVERLKIKVMLINAWDGMDYGHKLLYGTACIVNSSSTYKN